MSVVHPFFILTITKKLIDVCKNLGGIKQLWGVFTVLLVLALKVFYNYAETSDLIWLLKPSSEVTALFLRQEYRFIPQSGYYFPELNFIINKSCSGLVFLIISVCTSVFGFIQKTNSKHYTRVYFSLLIGSYILTILVNSSRILIDQSLKQILGSNVSIALHEINGIFVYLLFLVCYYLFLTQLFRAPKHARTT